MGCKTFLVICNINSSILTNVGLNHTHSNIVVAHEVLHYLQLPPKCTKSLLCHQIGYAFNLWSYQMGFSTRVYGTNGLPLNMDLVDKGVYLVCLALSGSKEGFWVINDGSSIRLFKMLRYIIYRTFDFWLNRTKKIWPTSRCYTTLEKTQGITLGK